MLERAIGIKSESVIAFTGIGSADYESETASPITLETGCLIELSEVQETRVLPTKQETEFGTKNAFRSPTHADIQSFLAQSSNAIQGRGSSTGKVTTRHGSHSL
jgi:hypothetical protein